MEIDANSSWQWMVLIALVLGLRHGLDLDHLATIDAITRTTKDNKILSKFVGFLFSFGHGLVVTSISLIIGSGLIKADAPDWLDGLGKWISIFFLIVFGSLNLWNVFQKAPSSSVPVGIKSYLAKKLIGKKINAPFIVLVGALFAFSVDTISQIGLFSLSAALVSGWLLSGILGISFTLGMMITDGLNGFFVSKLVQRADKASLIFSRGLGLAISVFSLTIAGTGLLELLG